MAGFVDVSNMSDLQVKRMNQMDEADVPVRRGYRKNVKPVINFQADDVWSAACAAQRINGSYVKYIDPETGKASETNRQIIDRFLADTSLITEADREQGESVRKYYKGLTFKILQGKKLNDFDNTAMVIANRDVIESAYDIAVIASLPSCYDRAVTRDNANRKLENASGGFIGKVGDKVKATVEVVRSVYSQQWGVYFVSGVTTDDQAVFFSYKYAIDSGKVINIQGTVKAHRDNTTQLNRVKVI